MENKKVKELKLIAKQYGLHRYSKLRKAELIHLIQEHERKQEELTRKVNSSIILDEAVPEINIPILKPVPARKSIPSLSSLTGRVSKQVKGKINKFSDWLISFVPETIRTTVNEKADKLKNDIKLQFNQAEKFEPNQKFEPKQKETALKGYLKTFRIDGVDGVDPKTFIRNSKTKILNLIKQQKKPINLKSKFILTCKFFKENPATGKIDENSGYFHSFVETITGESDLSELFNVMTSRLIELSQQFQNQGSGWQFRKVESLDINIDPFESIYGSSYIPLPEKIADKKAIINVKNLNDNECFKWAVTSAIYTAKNIPERLNKNMRDNSEKFNWKGIEFPVSLKQIVKFEKQNPFAVNVFGIEGEKVYPLTISKALASEGGVSKEREKQFIDLLLISKGETTHCWVKNKSHLLSSQVSKYKSSRFFCDRCINHFPNKPALEKHLEYCSNNKTARIVFAKNKFKDGKELDCPVFLKFKNFNRSMRVTFVVYADFECYTEKIQTCYPDESKRFTNQYQHHKPSGFCYLIKCFDDKLMKPKLVQYTAESSDEDISKKFIDSIEYEIRNIYRKFKFKKLIQMTCKDEIAFQNAEICHIYDKKLDNDKVRDHCHLTGKYRGAAHDYCNKNYQIPKFFPVIFHNLSGYDSHIFVKNLGVSEGLIASRTMKKNIFHSQRISK